MFVSFNSLAFKKFHKKKIYGKKFTKTKFIDNKCFFPKFCSLGFKLYDSEYLEQNQIESVRKVVRRFFKKNVYLKVNLLLNLPLTKKPISARMGKGKGKFDRWVSPLMKGRVFYEILTFNKKKHKYKYYNILLKKINSKLPVKVGLVASKY